MPTPERSPVASPGFAEALACATTSLAVISPSKSERSVTSAEAVANGLPVVSDWTVATYEPAVTAGPSEPAYEKPFPGATASFGGEEIVGVCAPPPGTTTRIAYARASAPAPPAPELEPAAPATSRASVSGTIASRAFTLGRIIGIRALRDTSGGLGRT
jgi:hypothetical protein